MYEVKNCQVQDRWNCGTDLQCMTQNVPTNKRRKGIIRQNGLVENHGRTEWVQNIVAFSIE